MSISKVQSNVVDSGASTVTSQAVTLPVPPTAGNLLVAHLMAGSNTGFTFGAPAGWQQAVLQEPSGASSTIAAAIWWKIATAADVETTSFTFTLTVAHTLGITIEEWNATWGWPVNALDQTVGAPATGSSSTALSTGTTATTKQAEELVVAGFSYKGALQSITGVTSGFTLDQSSGPSNNSLATYWAVTSAVGTQTCAGTLGSSAQFSAGVLATFTPNPYLPFVTPAAQVLQFALDGGSPAIVAKSVSDSAAGGDSGQPTLATIAVPVSDSATGGDSGQPTLATIAVPVTDSGAGDDSGLAVLVAPPVSDAGAGGDSGQPTLAANTFEAGPDAASGGDAALTGESFPVPDAATGGDAMSGVGIVLVQPTPPGQLGGLGIDSPPTFGTVTPAVADADQAAGEQVGINAPITVAGDAGAGGDSPGVVQAPALADADQAATESVSALVTPGGVRDGALGIDSPPSLATVTPAVGEGAGGGDTPAVVGPGAPIPDSGGGGEGLVLGTLQADVGAGVDQPSGFDTLATGDGGSGGEAIFIQPHAGDQGSGGEAPAIGVVVPTDQDLAATDVPTLGTVAPAPPDFGVAGDQPGVAVTLAQPDAAGGAEQVAQGAVVQPAVADADQATGETPALAAPVAPPVSEGATGGEQAGVSATLAPPDAAGGGDLAAVVEPLAPSDAAAGQPEGMGFGQVGLAPSDQAAGGGETVAAPDVPSVRDTALGAEAAAANPLTPQVPDAAAGGETVPAPLVGVAPGDAALGVEGVQQGAVVAPAPGEGAGGGDVATLAPIAAGPAPDTAGGGETPALASAVAPAPADLARGGEQAALGTVAPPIPSDAGAGGEGAGVAAQAPVVDATATGAELASSPARVPVADAGAGGAEQIVQGLVVTPAVADAGAGVEGAIPPMVAGAVVVAGTAPCSGTVAGVSLAAVLVH